MVDAVGMGFNMKYIEVVRAYYARKGGFVVDSPTPILVHMRYSYPTTNKLVPFSELNKDEVRQRELHMHICHLYSHIF